MKRTITFTVTVEQQTVDGCGNEVKPVSEGEIRNAVARGLDERNIQSVNVEFQSEQEGAK